MRIQDPQWQTAAIVAASAGSAGGTAESERTAPLRVDAQRNLEHVLRAAREVFGELGYGAPMEDVARRARVGVGTVYRRFPSKDVLVRRIAAEETDRLTDQARAALAQEEDSWTALTRFLRYAVGTGAGRLLPPEVLRAGAAQVTAVTGVTAASRLPQQRQDSLTAESGEAVPEPEAVPGSAFRDAAPPGAAAQDLERQDLVRQDVERQDPVRHDPALQVSARQDSALREAALQEAVPLGGAAPDGVGPVRLAPEDAAAGALLGVVGRLVEQARLVGELRADVTVADVLLVIATAAPSLPDAHQQAAASARVLEILLDGLRSRPAEPGGTAEPGVATAVETAPTPVATQPVEPSPFE